MTHARMRSLAALSLVLLIAVALVATLMQPRPGNAATRGLIFGAAAPNQAQVLSHEKVLGVRLQAARTYKTWNSTIIGRNEMWMKANGTTPFLSIKAQRAGKAISFAAIGAAKPGSPLYKDMQRMGAQIKAFGAPIYIIFNHEPEASSSRRSGGGPQFVAAWRKFVTVIRQSGAKNARFVATFTGFGFTRKDQYNIKNYYPGDAYVDAVAADVYNWYGCRSNVWKPLANLIEGIRVWGKSHPKEHLMLMEWGSTEDPRQPGRKAAWIRDAAKLFTQPAYSQFTAIMQWTGRNRANGKKQCNFDYTTSASATAAWAAMGRQTVYRAAAA